MVKSEITTAGEVMPWLGLIFSRLVVNFLDTNLLHLPGLLTMVFSLLAAQAVGMCHFVLQFADESIGAYSFQTKTSLLRAEGKESSGDVTC